MHLTPRVLHPASDFPRFQARRSLELKPVPEYDKLSNMALLPEPSAPRTATSSRGGATTGGAAGSGSLGHISSSRYQRNASSRPAGALGRTSLVVKLQQQGRQLIDMGRLQADLLSNTLGNRTDGQDYVNEGAPGLDSNEHFGAGHRHRGFVGSHHRHG